MNIDEELKKLDELIGDAMQSIAAMRTRNAVVDERLAAHPSGSEAWEHECDAIVREALDDGFLHGARVPATREDLLDDVAGLVRVAVADKRWGDLEVLLRYEATLGVQR